MNLASPLNYTRFVTTDDEGWGPPAALHRGRDRRQSGLTPDGPPTRALLLGGALVVAVWVAVSIVGGLVRARTGLDTVLVQALLETATAALAVVVALLLVMQWRLVGEAAALCAGVALLLLGVVTVGVTGLLPLVYEPVAPALLWLRPASRLVVLGLFAAAALVPAVDGRLRPGRLLLVAGVVTAAVTTAMRTAPEVARHLAGAADASIGTPASGYGSTLLVAAWAALAVAFLVGGSRQSRPLLSWVGVVVAGLGLAEVTQALAAEDPSLWSAGAQLLRLTALGVGLAGAISELQRVFGRQSRDLMHSAVSAAAAEARARAGRHELEERAHEARNALAAIEGASLTLEHYRDRLDPETRTSLVTALSSEVARLQRLVSAEMLEEACTDFAVAAALAGTVTGARARGAGILVDIDEHLRAFGRPSDTAEVVQNLIENARRYAPGSPVAIRAVREGDRVLVRVEDRGPGVDADLREAIFRRGVRGRHADGLAGSGLGLYVSGQLMRQQGGDLWLEDRPGGGAVFVLALPAVALSSSSPSPSSGPSTPLPGNP